MNENLKMIGKLFADRYEIIKLIGKGGMADVFYGIDNLLNKEVAIKVLKSDLLNNKESIRYFQNEAEAVSHLSHPNIVEVYDVGTFENRPYIVMEYLEGKTLKEIVREKGTLSPILAIHVLDGVLAALIHSHKKGIIHRDIKPHNIIVNASGDVKVMDFGIARILDSNATTAITTSVVGSVHYLAPEQASGGEIDERTDVYSCGIVLYEMLTGVLPYEGSNPVSVAVNHIRGGLIPPKDVNPSIPQELENIVLKAVRRDKTKRFQNALEMSITLEKVRKLVNAGKINQVGRIPFDEEDEVKKVDKKVKVIIAVAVGVIVLLIIGGVLLSKLKVDKNISAPYVVGKTEADAAKILTDQGLKYKIEDVVSSDFDEGQVTAQDPKGGALVAKNEIITLKVSKGKDAVTVPNVVGLGDTAGTLMLQNAGFTVNKQLGYSDAISAGTIISQSPDNKSKEKPGSEVVIIVSKGKKIVNVLVPNLVGQTQAAAESALTSIGLVVGAVNNKETADFIQGQVMDQSIPQGTSVAPGTRVNILVAQDFQQKIYNFKYVIAPGTVHNLRMEVKDSKGTRVSEGTMSATDSTFTSAIIYYGTGNLTVYDNNQLSGNIPLS